MFLDGAINNPSDTAALQLPAIHHTTYQRDAAPQHEVRFNLEKFDSITKVNTMDTNTSQAGQGGRAGKLPAKHGRSDGQPSKPRNGN